MLAWLHALVEDEAQFIIATHSPLLMAYPNAAILTATPTDLEPISYEETRAFPRHSRIPEKSTKSAENPPG